MQERTTTHADRPSGAISDDLDHICFACIITEHLCTFECKFPE